MVSHCNYELKVVSLIVREEVDCTCGKDSVT